MAQSNGILNEVSGDKTQPKEGIFTKAIEQQTAKMPSIGWVGLAMGSMAVSIAFEVFSGKRKDPAGFVGLWVPTFLLLGIYNKLVKLEGSDHFSKHEKEYSH